MASASLVKNASINPNVKYDFQIIEGANRGLNVKDIKEEFELKIAEKTIYKRLKKLKDDGIIKSKKEENNY